jgi:hypothetical protein
MSELLNTNGAELTTADLASYGIMSRQPDGTQAGERQKAGNSG